MEIITKIEVEGVKAIFEGKIRGETSRSGLDYSAYVLAEAIRGPSVLESKSLGRAILLDIITSDNQLLRDVAKSVINKLIETEPVSIEVNSLLAIARTRLLRRSAHLSGIKKAIDEESEWITRKLLRGAKKNAPIF
jgi:hypothetical protein